MNTAKPELILYGRHDCHLCDLAEQVLQQIEPRREFDKINIDDDLALLRRYGNAIPVLRVNTGMAELHWPFTTASLQRWLQQQE